MGQSFTFKAQPRNEHNVSILPLSDEPAANGGQDVVHWVEHEEHG